MIHPLPRGIEYTSVTVIVAISFLYIPYTKNGVKTSFICHVISFDTLNMLKCETVIILPCRVMDRYVFKQAT